MITTYQVPITAPPLSGLFGRGQHQPDHEGRYILHDLWCLHLYDWTGTVEVEGQPVTITPRMVHLVPPRTPLHYHYDHDSIHMVAHFEASPAASQRSLPSELHDPPQWQRWWDILDEARHYRAVEPRRAIALLWPILWELAIDDPRDTALTDVVRLAVRHIDTHLEDPGLTVPAIAAICGISHNHLTRLFKQAYGRTVVAFIRSRRIHRACQLLQHSSLPVGAVGERVGISDPQVFNKAFRQEMGMAPRSWRNSLKGERWSQPS